MCDLPMYVRNSDKWKLWHHWAAGANDDGTVPTSWGPSTKPTSRLIPVGETSAIILRAFGTNTENDTATVHISGWCENGPGQLLWQGALTLGAHTFTEELIPGMTNQAWFEVDTWTATYNAVVATSFGANTSALLVVPTIGYSHFYVEATDKDGTGTTMTALAILWKPYTAALTI